MASEVQLNHKKYQIIVKGTLDVFAYFEQKAYKENFQECVYVHQEISLYKDRLLFWRTYAYV